MVMFGFHSGASELHTNACSRVMPFVLFLHTPWSPVSFWCISQCTMGLSPVLLSYTMKLLPRVGLLRSDSETKQRNFSYFCEGLKCTSSTTHIFASVTNIYPWWFICALTWLHRQYSVPDDLVVEVPQISVNQEKWRTGSQQTIIMYTCTISHIYCAQIRKKFDHCNKC